MAFPTTEFTPLASALGGAMIGLSAVLLLALNGRIAGVTSFARRLTAPLRPRYFLEGAVFVGGLAAAPFVYRALVGATPEPTFVAHGAQLIAAGFLVGLGAHLGNGCTSGHGVCGLARLSPRSMAATAAFMAAGIATIFILRRVAG